MKKYEILIHLHNKIMKNKIEIVSFFFLDFSGFSLSVFPADDKWKTTVFRSLFDDLFPQEIPLHKSQRCMTAMGKPLCDVFWRERFTLETVPSTCFHVVKAVTQSYTRCQGGFVKTTNKSFPRLVKVAQHFSLSLI